MPSHLATVRLLNTAQGSLLDDEALVNALQSSKKTAEEVTEKLQISEQTEIKIDAAREVNIPTYFYSQTFTLDPRPLSQIFLTCLLNSPTNPSLLLSFNS